MASQNIFYPPPGIQEPIYAPTPTPIPTDGPMLAPIVQPAPSDNAAIDAVSNVIPQMLTNM